MSKQSEEMWFVWVWSVENPKGPYDSGRPSRYNFVGTASSHYDALKLVDDKKKEMNKDGCDREIKWKVIRRLSRSSDPEHPYPIYTDYTYGNEERDGSYTYGRVDLALFDIYLHGNGERDICAYFGLDNKEFSDCE